MKTLLALLLILPLSLSAAQEHIILVGGPALRSWEDKRIPKDQHDRWWGNFVQASSMRSDEIRKAYGAKVKIIWMVYKNGYAKRSREDGKPYLAWIAEQAKKRGAQLLWVGGNTSIIRAMNARPRRSVMTFDFFGHSNKHSFLLDYSCDIMGASSAWLHEKDLARINRTIFNSKAICKSWGCHSGESMNAFWSTAFGVRLIGAKGKTDYTSLSSGRMPTVGEKWVY